MPQNFHIIQIFLSLKHQYIRLSAGHDSINNKRIIHIELINGAFPKQAII